MVRRDDRYSTGAIALHWLIALAIIFQIILGWRMDTPVKSATTYMVFQLHKSVGISILLLSLLRLAWRLIHPAPPPAESLHRWERSLSGIVHVLFYAIMIGLPITGWIMVSASKTNIPTLLYGVVPWPHLPGLPELAAGPKHLWHAAGEFSHGALVKLTYVLLALHIGGAIKHQVIDRDTTLSRMVPGVRRGAIFDLKILALGLAFAVSIGAGYGVFSGHKPATTPVLSPPVGAGAISTVPGQSLQPSSNSIDWAVDKGSSLAFSSSWSGQPVNGQFAAWTADIRFDPNALDRSSITVTVDPASISTGDPQKDATLPTDDWFDTSKFPKAVYTANHFQKQGDVFIADGILTLKGAAKPVQLRFTLRIDGDKALVHGQAVVDRTAFGVGQGDYAATDQIPAGVTLNFNFSAHRIAAGGDN